MDTEKKIEADVKENEFDSLVELDDNLDTDEFPNEDLGTGEGEAGAKAPEAATQATSTEDVAKVEEKAADAEPPKTEAAVPAEVPTQEVKTEVSAPPVTTSEPEPVDLNAQYQEFISKSVDQLEKTVYSLTPEQKELLDTSPSELLPKLAATVHMQVLTQAATYMANMLPQMIPAVMERESADKAAEDKFFAQYPQLKEHKESVLRVARAYRQANPKVVGDQAMTEIATMAMVALRLPMPSVQQPTAPAVVARPVVPTSAQGGPASAQSRPTGSIWSEIVDLQED